MENTMQQVGGRTQLAGTNRLEVLLFSIGKNQNSGREEIFGINVFKVREVMLAPDITQVLDMLDSVEGMVSLRGGTIPVINLPHFCGIKNENPPSVLIVTEYSQYIVGFLVHAVDCIKRMAWDDVKVPAPMMTNQNAGLATAVAEIGGLGLVMIMDVEKILADTIGYVDEEVLYRDIDIQNEKATIIFADDSVVTRKKIQKTLEKMGMTFISAYNGKEAWELLLQIAEDAERKNEKVSKKLQLILTDIEIPEMDGYVFTQKIKSDLRFSDIPVVMYSSLTNDANTELGKQVGADAYVGKFMPQELSKTLLKAMGEV